MDIQSILKDLTSKFGAQAFDVNTVTTILKSLDLKSLNFNDIVTKLVAAGALKNITNGNLADKAGDLLGGKAGEVLGGLGKMFGK